MHKFDVSVAKKGDKWFGNKRKINKTKAEIRTIHLSGKVLRKINKTKKTFSLQGCIVWQISWLLYVCQLLWLWLTDDCLTTTWALPGVFNLHLLEFTFVYQFYSRKTTLVVSTFWNPVGLFAFRSFHNHFKLSLKMRGIFCPYLFWGTAKWHLKW